MFWLSPDPKKLVKQGKLVRAYSLLGHKSAAVRLRALQSLPRGLPGSEVCAVLAHVDSEECRILVQEIDSAYAKQIQSLSDYIDRGSNDRNESLDHEASNLLRTSSYPPMASLLPSSHRALRLFHDLVLDTISIPATKLTTFQYSLLGMAFNHFWGCRQSSVVHAVGRLIQRFRSDKGEERRFMGLGEMLCHIPSSQCVIVGRQLLTPPTCEANAKHMAAALKKLLLWALKEGGEVQVYLAEDLAERADDDALTREYKLVKRQINMANEIVREMLGERSIRLLTECALHDARNDARVQCMIILRIIELTAMVPGIAAPCTEVRDRVASDKALTYLMEADLGYYYEGFTTRPFISEPCSFCCAPDSVLTHRQM